MPRYHLLSRCSHNLELLVFESQGLAQPWQHRQQCQLSWSPWEGEDKFPERHPIISAPASPSLPMPIPVTGRPCGLFSVTRGPETFHRCQQKQRSLFAHSAASGVISSQPHFKLHLLIPTPQRLHACCSRLPLPLAPNIPQDNLRPFYSS